ncbi:sporulation protein [Micromonospora sp. CPCC 206060]|uniref:sporulation protein n=1 Tax=Micromonospora sp. CPCC 206060 TaxID=3122406 RepID=UPI002FF049CC
MGYTGVSPTTGWTGLEVRTALGNPSTRPGLSLPGRVTVTAGGTDVPVERISLGLVTQVEPADPAAPRRLVQFHSVPVGGGFVLPARQRRSVVFALPIPWETPVTVFGGSPLMSLRMGLRTEVALGPQLDQGALVPVFVHPLPVQAEILAAFDTLGFRLRQAALQQGRLPGVQQALPLHQKIGFWVGPIYAGPMTELEVTFVTNSAGLEVIFWVDRRLALAGIGHVSLSRFRVWHAGAEQRDWVSTVDGWLRETINRHAAAASDAHWSAAISESAHVSRPPDRPEPPGYGLGGTGGGAGIGGGGSDGT